MIGEPKWGTIKREDGTWIGQPIIKLMQPGDKLPRQLTKSSISIVNKSNIDTSLKYALPLKDEYNLSSTGLFGGLSKAVYSEEAIEKYGTMRNAKKIQAGFDLGEKVVSKRYPSNIVLYPADFNEIDYKKMRRCRLGQWESWVKKTWPTIKDPKLLETNMNIIDVQTSHWVDYVNKNIDALNADQNCDIVAPEQAPAQITGGAQKTRNMYKRRKSKSTSRKSKSRKSKSHKSKSKGHKSIRKTR